LAIRKLLLPWRDSSSLFPHFNDDKMIEFSKIASKDFGRLCAILMAASAG
jgi:hypothetical protein